MCSMDLLMAVPDGHSMDRCCGFDLGVFPHMNELFREEGLAIAGGFIFSL
jgi:hypothetical protein